MAKSHKFSLTSSHSVPSLGVTPFRFMESFMDHETVLFQCPLSLQACQGHSDPFPPQIRIIHPDIRRHVRTDRQMDRYLRVGVRIYRGTVETDISRYWPHDVINIDELSRHVWSTHVHLTWQTSHPPIHSFGHTGRQTKNWHTHKHIQCESENFTPLKFFETLFFNN